MTESAVMEPELKESQVNDQGHGGGDDGDNPGWLITYLDGKQPELIRLEGTDDEGMDEADIYERLQKADKNGHKFMKLGRWRGRIDAIRSLCWSEDVDLVELVAFDSIQDRLEDILDTVNEAANAVGEAAQGNLLLQSQIGPMTQAVAQMLELEEVLDEDDEDQGKGKSTKPSATAKQPMGKVPLNLGGKKGKLPPGIGPRK